MLCEGRDSCERAVVQSWAFVTMELMGYGGLMTENMANAKVLEWGGGARNSHLIPTNHQFT